MCNGRDGNTVGLLYINLHIGARTEVGRRAAMCCVRTRYVRTGKFGNLAATGIIVQFNPCSRLFATCHAMPCCLPGVFVIHAYLPIYLDLRLALLSKQRLWDIK